MKIFIAGGTGFIGCHVANILAEDHEITVGGLNPENPVIELDEEVERTRMDITEASSLDLKSFDAVVHLIGLSPLTKPNVPYEIIHVEGTENLIDACSSGTKLFYMSALGAERKDTEYLRTKKEAEDAVKDSDLEWTILRPSVVFGDGGEFTEFIRKVTTPYLTLLPAADTKFQPLHVSDAAELIANAVTEEHIGKIYEVGGPEKLSMRQITEAIYRMQRGTKVLKLPDILFKLSMNISEHLPFIPFGMDQYYSLQTDNVVEENDVGKLGVDEESMKTFREHLRL